MPQPPCTNDILLESGTNEFEILVFELGGQRFGVNVAKVREVIVHVDAVPTPGQAQAVKGVIRLRGNVLTVIDLHKQLNRVPQLSDESQWRIIITEFNGVTAAFEVEAVDSIYLMSWEDVRPVPDSGANGHDAVTGMTEVGEEIVMMLDLESIYDIIASNESHAQPQTENPMGVDRASCRVWLVEDSSFVRASIETMLVGSGYETVTAFRNGMEAWEALKAAVNNGDELPDALISDIEMPLMNGLHLCKKVKSHPSTAGTKVMLYSSLISPETHHKGVEVGVDEQFNKPILKNVVSTLDKWIAEATANPKAA